MWCRLAVVRTDASEERIASIIRMKRISELGTNLEQKLRLLIIVNVPSSPIVATRMVETIRSSETSVLTRVKLCNIPEDDILHSHRRDNLKSYIALTDWAQ
jgi:hypothetical protein